MAAIGLLIGFQIVYCYFGYRRRKSDEVWHVHPEELNFSHPVEVIGQGAFGVVLAAEYRGTRVAIKRVIPPQDVMKTRAGSAPSVAGSAVSSRSRDLEEGADSPGTNPTSDSRDSALSDSKSDDIFSGLPIAQEKSRLQKWMPFLFQDDVTRTKLNILGGTVSGGSTTAKSLYARLCFRCDETHRRQNEFQTEMRLLSRLRHPCEFGIQLLLLVVSILF